MLANPETVTSSKTGRAGEAPLPVILTGAGSGLGRAIAVALACLNYPLVLVGRRESALRETRSECLTHGAAAQSCVIGAFDVSAPEASESIVTCALAAFGSVGAVINNAAIARYGSISASEPTDWELMVRTNFLGPMALVKSALPALRRSRGVVVNICSIGGLIAVPGRVAYGATKAALLHATRSLARELAPDVRVNAVLPGPIDTPMYETLGLSPENLDVFREEMRRTTPLGRMGNVSDVVPWVELLLGKAGSWMTGSIIVVDGGRSC